MLRHRIIPCLLISNGDLYKTIKFNERVYIGDPLNAVKIFNEKEADELIILDIDATRNDKEPDFDLISALAKESRMPICYGGGINSSAIAQKIISYGVEKIALCSAIIKNVNLISECANIFGRQSVVVSLNVSKINGEYKIVDNCLNLISNLNIHNIIEQIQSKGAGEIVLNVTDNDGTMSGYDINLIRLIKDIMKVPYTILGGCGSKDHIKEVLNITHTIGISAGSYFVFNGKHKAVLISYPTHSEKLELLENKYDLF